MVSHYTVFGLMDINISNQEQYEKLISKRKKSYDHKTLPEIESFIRSLGADINYNPAQAFHIRGENAVHVPKIDQFENIDEYYRTVFHELGHWTGESWICNRDKTGNKYGNAGYAKEELTAEIYANFLAADYGFNLSEQSAIYIKDWLQAIKEKPLALMKAFSDAEIAYNWTATKLLKAA